MDALSRCSRRTMTAAHIRAAMAWVRTDPGFSFRRVWAIRCAIAALQAGALTGLWQGQLINGDYFKISPAAAVAGEKATDVVGWLHNHVRIRDVFDDAQLEDAPEGSERAARSYLVGNQTRWTTHTLAFQRLIDLEDVLRRTVILKKDAIIAAQVGAEKRRKQREALEKSARTLIKTIDDGAFWEQLSIMVDDLEPITYMTNINQADDVRPDQVVLSLAGVFLHFANHADSTIRAGMTKSVEKRWKALDQPLFIFSLVLNPYEVLSRFGDKANVDVFVLNAELLSVRCVSMCSLG